MSIMTVDVMIPTYRPGKDLEQLILRLKKQDYPIRRIFIVNTKTESCPDFLKQIEGVEVQHIDKREFDHGGTRDRAFRQSDAEVVVFMTQDAMPVDRCLISNLMKGFSEKDVSAVYARQLPKRDCSIIETYTRGFNYPDASVIKSKDDLSSLGIKTFFCSNVCAAYRKDIYDELGGFEKHTIFNEDMILAGKMVLNGYRIAYAADAKVRHSHNYSCRQQFHRNFDLAVSQADHPEVFADVKSESEGMRLVIQTMKYLLEIHKPWLVPQLVLQSGCKYLGYKMGRNYKKLPRFIILKCTMNASYWENNREK